MRTRTTTFLLLACFFVGSANVLIANNVAATEAIPDHNIIDLRLHLPIIGTKNIAAEVFSYDIVGVEANATAKHLTSGITKDIHTLITDLRLDKNYVKIGIKLKWGENSKYFLLDKEELTTGKLDLKKGRE